MTPSDQPTGAPATIRTVAVPDPALVVLIGAAGSGKSTWALDHYRRAEVVSSDELRGIVGSGPADLDAPAPPAPAPSPHPSARRERTSAARLPRGPPPAAAPPAPAAPRRTSWRDAA